MQSIIYFIYYLAAFVKYFVLRAILDLNSEHVEKYLADGINRLGLKPLWGQDWGAFPWIESDLTHKPVWQLISSCLSKGARKAVDDTWIPLKLQW